MKRSLLALAISASIAAPTVALAEGLKVYGRMDVSLDNVSVDNDTGADNDSGSNWAVSSNASRFGVKGKAKLTDDLKAIYKIEWEVDGTGDGKDLAERNRYVGLTGGFGTVLLGKMDSPLKKAQGKIDLFGDHAGDIKNVIEGELRASNVVAYASPKIADSVTATLAVIQVEQNEAEGNCDTLLESDGSTTGDDCESGLLDAFSASVVYSKGGVYAALALDENVPAKKLKSHGKRVDTKRLAVGYKVDALKLGLIYSISEEDEEYNADAETLDEQTGFILSGAYTFGKTVVKGQYGASETEREGRADDVEITMIALGVEQKFTKKTKAFAEYVILSEDDGSADEKENTLSVGIQHKF